MRAARPRRPQRLLTEVELELMTLLWREGGGTVAEVLAALPEERKLAYTSVSTILRILAQKGIVTSETVGRGHRYIPAVVKSDYEAFALDHVVGKVFGGEPMALVRRLIDATGLTSQDAAALKAIVDKKERPKGR
jgi:predicted transcriptional regulator